MNENEKLSEETRLKIEKIEKYKKEAKKKRILSVYEALLSGGCLLITIGFANELSFNEMFSLCFESKMSIFYATLASLCGYIASRDASRVTVLEDKVETLKEELGLDEEKGKKK